MTKPALILIIIAVVSLVVGVALLRDPHAHPRLHDLGVGLLTSCVTAFAIFALQLTVDANERSQAKRDSTAEEERANRDAAIAREQEKTAKALAEEQSFRLSLSLTQDLTGFNPNGHSLAGFYLSGKVFNSANFRKTDLRYAQLRGANLRNVDGVEADFEGANLLYADLSQSVLTGANLAGANLEGAKFELADVENARSFAGATVNADTCWPEGFLETVAKTAQLIPKPILLRPDHPVKASLGKTCPGG